MISSPIIAIDRQRPGPLYGQIKQALLDAIRQGRLRPGDRLPPTRRLAQELGLNRGTVATAYEELLSTGALESHVGRGTFVADNLEWDGAPSVEGYRWSDHFAGLMPPASPAFPETTDTHIPLDRNMPDPELFPIESFRKAMDTVLVDVGPDLLEYSPAGGRPAFLEFLSQYLTRHRGFTVDTDELLVVNGSQQALDLVVRALLRPGDTVAAEDPTYAGALDLFRTYGVRVVGIAMDDEGMRTDRAEAVLARERPKLLYTMPAYQNPTGRSLSPARRTALLDLTRSYGVPLVEDDFDGELPFQGAPLPALKAQPGGEHVIYLGTPSKMLFPGLRLGWMAAPAPVVARLSRIKQISDLSGSPLLQAAFAQFERSGALDKHKARVRRAYAARARKLVAALERHMPAGTVLSRPQGGMTMMVTLPLGWRALDILPEAARRGVLFTPGPWFSLSHGENRLRLCIGSVPPRSIEPGVRRLAEAMEAVGPSAPVSRQEPGLPQL